METAAEAMLPEGALLGMRVFRHKTKHWKFKILVPLFLILQLALAGWIIYR